MNKWQMSSLLCFCAFTTIQADTLETSSEKMEGLFESYEKANFLFRLETGKLIKKPRISVRKMTIENPREATFTRATSGKSETYTLSGYDRGKFLISKRGKATELMAMHIGRVSIATFVSSSEDNGEKGKPKVSIDLTRLKGRQLTPAQKTIIARYQKARKSYKEFLAKSSAMVKEMDTATGTRREQLLNDLRVRKNTEQPIKKEYSTSRTELLKEFPELLEPEPEASQEGESAETTTQTEIVITIPKLAENQVIFIDTSILTQAGALTEAQAATIKSYNDATKEYQDKINLTDSDRDALTADLKQAQQKMFKAFPTLKIIEK